MNQKEAIEEIEVHRDYEVHQEKRFAVVMYGGVSLAIYMNGVAQELYRMVKSTVAKGDLPTAGTEEIYRFIAEKLNARFVIDIITGTSAGGINGIFLAKALTNALPFDQLEQLWLDEGDIDVLLNDKLSFVEGLKTDFKRPRALLNGRRMYHELLEALNKMDAQPEKAAMAARNSGPKSFVNELDLFVTATDLQGQNTPIRLSDKVVFERRHRNVFRFRFNKDSKTNDFKKEVNPFLAYAARCTSSFPFAFEPMRLEDISGALSDPNWGDFYQRYLLDPNQTITQLSEKQKNKLRLEKGKYQGRYDTFSSRSFADGGYLDNKPFSYAIETITLRGSDVPVDRKLLYVEPSPESVPDALTIADAPNAIENALKAFGLARYETIREDLQRIITRNRLIERVRGILDGTLADIQSNPKKRDPVSVDNWLGSSLEQMIDKEGVGYGGYIRLQTSKVTDELAEILTCQAGFDDDSDLFSAVRYLVSAWRKRKYIGQDPGREGAEDYSQFLYDFNLGFFIRRLNFTIANIDRLYRIALGSQPLPEIKIREDESPSTPYDEVRRLTAAKQLAPFKEELRKIRRQLSHRLVEIYKLRNFLKQPEQSSVLTKAVQALKLDTRMITEAILNASSREMALGAAGKIIKGHDNQFQKVADIIKTVVSHAEKNTLLCKHTLELGTLTGGDYSEEALRDQLIGYLQQSDFTAKTNIKLEARELSSKSGEDPKGVATWVSAYYFRMFSYYDMVAFPIMQSSKIGEEIDPVEIIRISPDDATALSKAGERKLAGATLMHFGAFLDRTWRKNDILWGRLDGAERIISALVAGTALENRREELITRAHHEILSETFHGNPEEESLNERRRRGREMLDLLMSAVLGKTARDRKAVNGKIDEIKAREEITSLLNNLIAGNLGVEKICADYFKDYEADRQLDPRHALQTLSRSSQVIGKMLDAISEEQSGAGIKKRAAAWLVRLGRLLWGLVEISTPHTILGTLAGYWLNILLLISILIIVIGPMLSSGDDIRRFGVSLFLIVVVFHMARWALRKVLIKKFTSLRVLKNILISAVTAFIVWLLVIGILHFSAAWSSIIQFLGFGPSIP